jgi:hypothetical protein
MSISNKMNVGHSETGRGIFNLNNSGEQEMNETIENMKYADGFANGFRQGEVEGTRHYNTGIQNGYANGNIVGCNAMMDVIYALRHMHPQQRLHFLNLLATIVEV